MCLDAHGILDLGITGNFLQSLIPRPCLCCLNQTGSQGATTAILIHIPPFDVGDWGRLAPFRVVLGVDWRDGHDCTPVSPCIIQVYVIGGIGPGCLVRGPYRSPSSRTTDSGAGQSPCSPNHESAWVSETRPATVPNPRRGVAQP